MLESSKKICDEHFERLKHAYTQVTEGLEVHLEGYRREAKRLQEALTLKQLENGRLKDQLETRCCCCHCREKGRQAEVNLKISSDAAIASEKLGRLFS